MKTDYAPRGGAIAAGHPVTAGAGAQMLQAGGNAVDAAVAAAFASFISEYSLSTVGGGGFALVHQSATGRSDLYDFFSAAPGLGRTGQPPLADIDFQQITVDYGPSTQQFYVGRGSVAVPGNVAGLCALARDHGRLPLPVLLEPAIQLARHGCPVNEMQAFMARLIRPILLRTPESRALFGRAGGDQLIGPGERLRMPALADSLEALGRYGPRLYYHDDIARAIVADQNAHGGLLTLADLRRYRVIRRRPLSSPLAGHSVLTNPPPSRGGLLISFSLRLLDAVWPERLAPGSAQHLSLLAEVMRVTNLARQQLEAAELPPSRQAVHLLGPRAVARWTRALHELLALPPAQRPSDATLPARSSTTQISVIDQDGLAVSLTTSGGEGPGFVVPGTGLILNNMLGEADLHPQGFHRSKPGQRVPSMMAPSIVLRDGQPVLATGSGGANRIRSAIVQVLLNTLVFDLPLRQAVEFSRIHFEAGVLQAEGGNDAEVLDRLAADGYSVNRWQERHMYFGGAHSVARAAGDQLIGVGDPRRGGSALP